MGIFLLAVSILLEIVGMAFSYWYGAHFLGIGAMWASMINSMGTTIPILYRYHLHVSSSTIGLAWLSGNLALHAMAIVAYVKDTLKKRAKMGNPGIREVQTVEQALRQMVTARPSGTGLASVSFFSWPLTFSYGPGQGTSIYFIGQRMVIGEGLFRNRYLKPLLAHALGHYNSSDINLREIQKCLPPALLVCGVLVGLPIGLGPAVTFFFWKWYWRQRIYAADLFAARLGQAADLIRALDSLIQPRERQKNVLFREYPYAAERIDRLMRATGISLQSAQGQQQHQTRTHP